MIYETLDPGSNYIKLTEDVSYLQIRALKNGDDNVSSINLTTLQKVTIRATYTNPVEKKKEIISEMKLSELAYMGAHLFRPTFCMDALELGTSGEMTTFIPFALNSDIELNDNAFIELDIDVDENTDLKFILTSHSFGRVSDSLFVFERTRFSDVRNKTVNVKYNHLTFFNHKLDKLTQRYANNTAQDFDLDELKLKVQHSNIAHLNVITGTATEHIRHRKVDYTLLPIVSNPMNVETLNIYADDDCDMFSVTIQKWRK